VNGSELICVNGTFARAADGTNNAINRATARRIRVLATVMITLLAPALNT
jgi:hypothetical protein